MNVFLKSKRVRLSAVSVASALLLAGCCGCEVKPAKGDEATTANTATNATTNTALAGAGAVGALAFATSDAFPYFDLPEGYVVSSVPMGGETLTDKFSYWADGKGNVITGETNARHIVHSGDAYNADEFKKALDTAIKNIGGVETFNGKIPSDKQGYLDELHELAVHAGDVAKNDVSTYLIKRDDGNVWLHFSQSDKDGHLVITHEQKADDTAKPVEAETEQAAPAPTAEEIQAQIKESGKIALQVNFATGKTDILPVSQAQISEVATFLKAHPEIKVAFNGYTDNVGDSAKNQTLSEGRANAVMKAIIAQGVEAERVSAKGFGDKDPVADNATADGRAKNRRVELVQVQ